MNIERVKFPNTSLALDIGSTLSTGSVYIVLYTDTRNQAPDIFSMGYWSA